MSALDVLYQDADFIAVDKPSGLLVHRSPIDKSETEFALQRVRDQIGQRVYAVHRLDKPTSGVLLFALNPEAQIAASRLFENAGIAKEYRAIVRGWTDTEGRIDYALAPMQDFKDQAVSTQAQSAITVYATLARVELPIACGRYTSSRYSLLRLVPETGRKHQLRRHMKHLFHPIIGDTTHGDNQHNRLFQREFDNSRLLLKAHRLEFRHPGNLTSVSICTRQRDGFDAVCERLWPSSIETTA